MTDINNKTLSKHKILIVEDDRSIAELQRDYLEINGFSADIEEDGYKGCEAALKGIYNLIILDVMLPITDGIEILKKVREKLDVPVIFISAKTEEIDKIRALGLGADDYMTKPFSPGEMVARVKAHLARQDRLAYRANLIINQGTNDPGKLEDLKYSEVALLHQSSFNISKDKSKEIIQIRGMKIDKLARLVYMNGNELVLKQKEFELLLFLAQNPNRVFGREELYEKVWGMEALGDSATVTVHIARIRNKLEADPENPQYLETVWGAGYRFRV